VAWYVNRICPDLVIEKLRDDDGLDAGYLYFRQALSKLDVGPDLEVDWFFRSNQRGRKYYGGQISKENWCGPDRIVDEQDEWQLDGDRNFYIHIEPQYDVLNHILKLYLHYEVYPYKTEAWVQENIRSDQYDAYVARRTRFAELLQTRTPDGWVFAVGYNQLARASLEFESKTFSAIKGDIEALVGRKRSGAAL
jgi:hypothetical protein